MRKLRFAIILLAVCLFFGTAAPSALALSEPEAECSYCVLLETNTNTVLYQRAANERTYPASLTKMMTVLLAVEAIEKHAVMPDGTTAALDTAVTASPNFNFDMIADGSTAYIMQGETMSLEDLLYCAMLSSANEACNIIAEYVGGSVASFVELMNRRAAELGCTGTHFANTHGLPNNEHYTTAWDLSLIAREALTHPFFRELCSTKQRTLNPTNVSAARELSNTNSLINPNEHYPGDYLYEGAAGIKTGFTNDAGYCLASVATREGKKNIELLTIVLKSPAYDDNADGALDRFCNFTDAASHFDWGFEHWDYREILRSTDIITQYPVSMGDGADTVPLRPGTSIVRFLPEDEDLSLYKPIPNITAAKDGKLEAPITAGQVLGEISVMRGDQLVGTVSLVASTDVALSRGSYMRSELQKTMSKGFVRWTILTLVLLFAGYMLIVVRYRVKRRRYIAKVRNARIAEQIAAGDDDVREWYESGSTSRAKARPAEHKPKPSLSEPTRKTDNAPPLSEPTRKTDPPPAGKRRTVSQQAADRREAAERERGEQRRSSESAEPRRRPAVRPAAPADPLDPKALDDQNFRDYFEEFFGEKKTGADSEEDPND